MILVCYNLQCLLGAQWLLQCHTEPAGMCLTIEGGCESGEIYCTVGTVLYTGALYTRSESG